MEALIHDREVYEVVRLTCRAHRIRFSPTLALMAWDLAALARTKAALVEVLKRLLTFEQRRAL